MRLGFDEQSFWDMTPRQIQRAMVARREVLTREQINEHNGRAWLAWHIAAMTRAKKMPELSKLLHKEPRKPQTWQEQLAIARMWNAVTPGKIHAANQDNA